MRPALLRARSATRSGSAGARRKPAMSASATSQIAEFLGPIDPDGGEGSPLPAPRGGGRGCHYPSPSHEPCNRFATTPSTRSCPSWRRRFTRARAASTSAWLRRCCGGCSTCVGRCAARANGRRMTSLWAPSPGQDTTRTCVAAVLERRAITAAAPAVGLAAARAAALCAGGRTAACAGAGRGQSGVQATVVGGGAADGNWGAHPLRITAVRRAVSSRRHSLLLCRLRRTRPAPTSRWYENSSVSSRQTFCASSSVRL